MEEEAATGAVAAVAATAAEATAAEATAVVAVVTAAVVADAVNLRARTCWSAATRVMATAAAASDVSAQSPDLLIGGDGKPGASARVKRSGRRTPCSAIV